MTASWILVAEDSEDDARMLLRVLRRAGVDQIVRAVDGRDAMRLLESSGSKPDLVILDIKMPLMSGLDVLREVGGALPCVIFTSSDEPRDREAAQALGCREFATKPVDYDAYRCVVEGIVARHLPSLTPKADLR
ncbi:MAG: response regulator [Fimbriimonas sp.]